METENRERRAELQRQERRLQQREENLDHKMESVERRERAIGTKEQEVQQLRTDIETLKKEETKELERISALTQAEAKELLLKEIETEVRQDAARRIREIEAEAKADADRRAREIISTAIQRYAADQVAETTVSVVPLPNDEMKGRIIGREGRNIRALEQATGVDLIVDDTPEAVILSAFDPVRREVARRRAEQADPGRPHPPGPHRGGGAQGASWRWRPSSGRRASRPPIKAGVHGLHPELIKLLGRLKYRTSYGQNVLDALAGGGSPGRP